MSPLPDSTTKFYAQDWQFPFGKSPADRRPAQQAPGLQAGLRVNRRNVRHGHLRNAPTPLLPKVTVTFFENACPTMGVMCENETADEQSLVRCFVM